MQEKDVTTDFKHYLEKHRPFETEVYELKIQNETKSKSFAFNRVKDHQIEGLIRANTGFWFKISDTTAKNGFSSQKPFDGIWIVSKGSYVVIVYYTPRKHKTAVCIPIEVFLKTKMIWKKKSIKRDEWNGIDYVFSVEL